MKPFNRIWGVLTALIIVSLVSSPAWAGTDSIVTKETVKSWMENGNVIILDARSGRDWSSSEFKIKGAFRADPGRIHHWKSQFDKESKIVLYCA